MQFVLRTYLFTIPLVFNELLGTRGERKPYSYDKFTCVSESNPEVKCELRKLDRLARGLVWVLIRIIRTKRDKSGCYVSGSEEDPVKESINCM